MVVPGHSFPRGLEESSRLGSSGIFERVAGGSESGLVATSLLRVTAAAGSTTAPKQVARTAYRASFDRMHTFNLKYIERSFQRSCSLLFAAYWRH
jgi:hypothetical protein